MGLVITVEAPPIVIDSHGVAKITGTRVTLETVLGAFNDGAIPEEIVHQYPTLKLGDVYAVVAYYLREKSTVDAYLTEQEQIGERVRRENEARFPPNGIRERLLSRKREQEIG